MTNIVRQIREATGLTQIEFARRIGRSLSQLQNYEKGVVPSEEVIRTLKTIADEFHRGDLGIALTSDDWQVQADAAQAPGGKYNRRNQALHDALEQILESGNKQAIDAVAPGLVFFAEYVRQNSISAVLPPKKGKAGRREVG